MGVQSPMTKMLAAVRIVAIPPTRRPREERVQMVERHPQEVAARAAATHRVMMMNQRRRLPLSASKRLLSMLLLISIQHLHLRTISRRKYQAQLQDKGQP